MCVCVFFLEIYVAFNMNIPKLVRRLTYFNSYTFTFCNSNTNILFIQSYTVHREHADIFLLSSPNVFFWQFESWFCNNSDTNSYHSHLFNKHLMQYASLQKLMIHVYIQSSTATCIVSADIHLHWYISD